MLGLIIKNSIYVLLTFFVVLIGEFNLGFIWDLIKVPPIVFNVIYVCTAILAFLGLRLNQTRIFWSALLFAAFFYTELNWDNYVQYRVILELSLPWIFLGLFLFKEGNIFSRRTLYRLIAASLIPIILLFSYHFQHGIILVLVDTSWSFLSHSTMLAMGILFLLSFFLDTKGKVFARGLLLSLFSLIYILHCNYYELSSNILFVGTLLCLLVLLHIVYSQYWNMAYRDQLTGVANRRALDEALDGVTGLYTLGMIDIDHFKQFNDNFGHDEGDNVLRLTAKLLQQVFGDKIYRYGGEEFCILLSGVTAKDAFDIADQARAKLESRPFYIRQTKGKRKVTKKGQGPTGKKVQITISIGLSNSTSEIKDTQQVLKKADTALYKAKKAGRNRVEIKV